MKARAFWVEAPGQGRIRTEALPPLKPGQVRLRTVFSGISRGTESLVFHGKVPPSQVDAMRGPHQEGKPPGPVKYGYMSVARVETGPDAGRLAFCLHPHQDVYQVDASMVNIPPAGIPADRAVLAANVETALNGVWDAAPGPGDRVAVVGGGVVGCLVAWLIGRMPATDVTLVDVLPERRDVATALGVGFALPQDAPTDCDLVVHCSGSAGGLTTSLALAGVESTVLEMSWFGAGAVAVPLGEAFHSRRLTLRASQVGRIPPSRAPRWTHRRRMAVVLELLRDPVLDVLLGDRCALAELPAAMATLTASAGALCHLVTYPHD